MAAKVEHLTDAPIFEYIPKYDHYRALLPVTDPLSGKRELRVAYIIDPDMWDQIVVDMEEQTFRRSDHRRAQRGASNIVPIRSPE